MLNGEAREILARGGENEVLFSVACAWEIAIKVAIGKLKLPEDPLTFVPRRVAEQGMTHLSIEASHALVAGALPAIHRDPFDRMLVAQASMEDVPLLTADPRVAAYPVRILWGGTDPRPALKRRLIREPKSARSKRGRRAPPARQ
jgi:PIN domain nuclease of toxin-antitoxin system